MAGHFYRTQLNWSSWDVPKRYINLKPVGHGAYGCVCAARDLLGIPFEKVAIKKFNRPFQSVTHAKCAYRELRLLRRLRHENIIELTDCFTPDSSAENLQDLYFVTELLGADLFNVMKIQRLSEEQIQIIVYEILRGLKYIHSAGIIHRDLKPSNIAINEDYGLKILDFGLARETNDEMTGYVATRWYRAPEIILNWMHYTQTADIWSVGCILAELLSGKPLLPGNDQIDQLHLIMDFFGTPDEDFLAKIESDEARTYVSGLRKRESVDFADYLSDASPQAVDLVGKMLTLDPEERLTAAEALEHPYFAFYHDSSDEPTTIPIQDENIDLNMNITQWKELIWNEINRFSK